MSVVNPPEARNDCQDFRFKLLCRLKVFAPGDAAFSQDVSLVAAASRFGLVFVGCPSGVQVLRTASLAGLGTGGVRGDVSEFPRRSVPLPSQPSHLGVSCDQGLLAVVARKDACPHAFVYHVPSFLSQNASPACEVRLSASPQSSVTGLAWNPGVHSVLACCLSDGGAGVFELKAGSIETNVLPPEAQATCLSWSPKGKQLVVGDRAGALTQYKPDLKAVKKLAAPVLEGAQPCGVVAVAWLSNYQFAAVYKDQAGTHSLMIVNAPKSGDVSFINYEDICYSSAEFRPSQFYIIHQPTWNVLMVGSANSTEVGVLGLAGDQATWQQWIQEDEARAELPYQSVGVRQETFPVGMALDTSWQENLPWGDNQVLPPMPLLMLLSHQGLLCLFHAINLRPGAAALCAPPELPGDQSGLALFSAPPAEEQRPPQPQQQLQQQQLQLQQQQQQLQQQPQQQQSWFANSSFPNARVSLNQKFEDVSPAAASSATALAFGPKPTYTFGSGIGLLQAPSVAPASLAKNLFGASEPKTGPGVPAATATQSAASQGGFPVAQQQQAEAARTPPPVILRLGAGSRGAAGPEAAGAAEAAPGAAREEARAVVEAAIREELDHFQEEMDDLRARAAAVSCHIGGEEEVAALRAGPEKLLAFCRELKATTLGQAAEIQDLKGVLLETFAWLEDARSRVQLHSSPRYMHLTQLRTLDHINLSRSREMDRLADYLEGQLQEVNRCLDSQWAAFQQSSAKKRMQIPTLEAVYRTMVAHHSILTRQSALVRRLLARLPSVRKQRIGSVPLIASARDEAEKELSDLAEALVTNLKVSDVTSSGLPGVAPPAAGRRSLGALKQSRLRDFLQQRPVARISSTRSAPIGPATFAPAAKPGGISSGTPVVPKPVGQSSPGQPAQCKPSTAPGVTFQGFTSPISPQTTSKELDSPLFSKGSFVFSHAPDSSTAQLTSSYFSLAGGSVAGKPAFAVASKNTTSEKEVNKVQADSRTSGPPVSSVFSSSSSPKPPAAGSPKVVVSSVKPQKSSLSSLSDIVASIGEPAPREDKPAVKQVNDSATAVFGSTAASSPKSATMFKFGVVAQSSSEPSGGALKSTFTFTTAVSNTEEKTPFSLSFSSGGQNQEKPAWQTSIFGAGAAKISLSSESSSLSAAKDNVPHASVFGLATSNFNNSLSAMNSPKESPLQNKTVVSTSSGDILKETSRELSSKVISGPKTDSLDQSVPLFGNLSLDSSAKQNADAFRSVQSMFFSTPASNKEVESSVLQTPETTPPPEPVEATLPQETVVAVVPTSPQSAEATVGPTTPSALKLPADASEMKENASVKSSMSSFSFGSLEIATSIAEAKPQSVDGKNTMSTPVAATSAKSPSESKSPERAPTSNFSFTLPTTSATSSAFAPKTDSAFSQSTVPEAQSIAGPTSTTTTSAASFFGQPVCSPSSFGQSPANIFGQAKTSLFTPTTSTATPFGQTSTPSVFGQASTSVFGQASTASIFGNANAAVATTPSAFGQAKTSTAVFGQKPTGAPGMFGQTSSVFGQASTPTTTAASTFGTPTTAPVFGQTPTTTPSLFGQAATSTSSPFGQAQPVFGSPFGQTAAGAPVFGQTATTTTATPSLFGQTPPTGSFFSSSAFGQSSGSVFGQAAKPGFGSSGGSVFGGGTSTPAFSTSAASSAGSPFQPGGGSVFGGGANSSVGQAGFGASPFSQPKTGGFGSPPVFGQPRASSFGSSPSFGAAPAFGAAPSFSSPPKVFGNSSPVIGTGFGAAGQAPSAFESMASQNTVTFGNLAQVQGQGQAQGFGSPQASVFGNTQQSAPAFPATSTFGGSSFSSWR